MWSMDDVRGWGRLLSRDIWLADYSGADRRTQRFIGFLRWLYMVVISFVRDQCLLRAAAMAYTTILSLAPLLAVALSISKGLGVQNKEFVRDFMDRITAGRSEMTEAILAYVNNTSFTTLGVVGMVMLFVTTISLISTVEDAFNSIWRVQQGRSTWRKVTDYLTVLVLCPIFVFAALSMTVSLQQEAVVQRVLSLAPFNYFYLGLLKFAPYLMIWLAFLCLYIFIPNTKVWLRSAAVGGVAAGTMWQLAQWGYIRFQVGAANANAIYGSFAQFPLFLVWMYISWVIVLLGAEIAYATQHWHTFQSQIRAGHINQQERAMIAVLVMLFLTNRFERREPPATNEDMAVALGAPRLVVDDVTNVLHHAGVLAKVEVAAAEHRTYTLALPPEQLRLVEVVQVLALHRPGDAAGACEVQARFIDPRFDFIRGLFDGLGQGAVASAANQDFKSLYQELCRQGTSVCL